MAEFSDYIVFVDESGDHSLTSIDPDIQPNRAYDIIHTKMGQIKEFP